MKFFSFSRFFQQMWRRKRSKRLTRASARRRGFRVLGLEELEDRLAPSSASVALPAPLVSNPNQIGSGFDAQVAMDPLNHLKMVEVHTTGASIQGNYSTDGGQTWNGFGLPGNVPNPSVDPTTNPASPNTAGTAFAVALSPSISFDRSEMFYVVSVQEDNPAAGPPQSGAVVLDKFDFSGPTPVVIALTPPGGVDDLNPNPGASLVLYRWYGFDAAYNPYVGVDSNIPTFTDPTTNASQIDTLATTSNQSTNANPVVTSVAGNMLAGDTTMTVVSSAGVPATPFVVQVDNELIQVTGVAGTTWTISRGFLGTTAAAHFGGIDVTLPTMQAALAGGIAANSTFAFVNSTPGTVPSTPFYAAIDNEIVEVTDTTGGFWTIVRGDPFNNQYIMGTIPNPHLGGATITLMIPGRTTTTTQPIIPTDTTINVAYDGSAPPATPFLAEIDSEIVQVTAAGSTAINQLGGISAAATTMTVSNFGGAGFPPTLIVAGRSVDRRGGSERTSLVLPGLSCAALMARRPRLNQTALVLSV